MATITRFEDLEIWQKARILTKRVFVLSKKEKFAQDYRFKNQILSSSGSIMDNIAEGFERGGNTEFKQFCRSPKVQPAKLVHSFIVLSISNISQMTNLRSCFLNMKAYPEK